ncbi:MAG: chromosome segregation protein SMC [Planctomycetota bacterium]
MELSRLELIGFKSFAERTEFVFDRGITALVGPNGCGKSNIVDAIKWILGEQSVKSLRGGEMADVIFSGNDTRRPLGFAEASLTLSRIRDTLPMDADEVTVTRRVYRNGEGEYFINRQPSRLRDIRELFMDTGIGVNAYSLVEQGRVGYLLQANSAERRVIFEEAAGISKFKARKKAAVARMEKTDQHLVRLKDIIEEVNRRLHSVRIQAGKARRYTEYKEELKRLRVSLYQNDYREAKARKAQADADLERICARHTEIASRLAELQTRREEGELRISQIEGVLAETREERGRLDMELRLEERAVAEARRRAEELVAERARIEENLAEALARMEREAGELEALCGEIESAREEAQRRAEESRATEGARAAFVNDLAAVEERLRQTIAVVEDLFREESGLRNEIASIKANAANAQSAIERIVLRLEERDRKRREAVDRAEAVREESDRLARGIEEHQVRIQELGEEEREKDASVGGVREELAALRARRVSCESRRETLEDLHRRREGVSAGARAVLGERDRGSAEFAGVVGLFGDLIRASGASAKVLEAAVAHAADALVVNTFQDAYRAIEFVAARRMGRITCVIREGVSGRVVPASWNGFRPLIDLLPEETRDDPAVRSLLGRACLVENLDAAREGVRRLPEAAFVTERGEVLDGGDRLSGGDGAAGPGIISRRAELDRLGEELAGIAGAEETLTARVNALLGEREGLDRERRSEADAADALRCRHAECFARAESAAGELKRLGDEVLADESELGELRGIATELCRRLAEAEADLAAREERRQALELERGRDVTAKETLRVRLAEVEEKLQGERVVVARFREKAVNLDRQRADREAVAQERHSFVESARGEIERSCAREKELRSEAADAAGRIETRRESCIAVDKRLGDLEAERGNLRNTMLELEDELRGKRSLVSAVEEEREKVRLEQQRYEIELSSLVERLREEYGLDLDDVSRALEVGETPDWDAVRAQIEELRRKIDNMGAVNMEALNELAGLEERSTLLEGQRADVQKARADLEELIRRIEKVSEERFRTTFARVRENFQEFFRKLFGGGRADVFLEDETNVLDCGIEIMAKPPGKEPRAVSLLSGGEKALTTIALLFAILRSKPSPFVILDEVDAPLDETNVERFVNLVKDFLQRSQFIIITHSKRTMSMANCLYGVTMEEKGVSRKVEVQLEKYTPPADEPPPPVAEEDEELEEAPIERDILVDASASDDEDPVGEPTGAVETPWTV